MRITGHFIVALYIILAVSYPGWGLLAYPVIGASIWFAAHLLGAHLNFMAITFFWPFYITE